SQRDYATGRISNSTVSVTNSGLIQVEGEDGAGISASSETGSTTVTNRGEILALGDGNRGIGAESGYENDGERVPDGGVTVNNSGLIELNGEELEGISTHTGTGANLVENTGRIDLTGDSTIGITATTNAGAVTVRSSGDVITRGSDSYGILSASLDMIAPPQDVAEALVRAGKPVPVTVGPAAYPITIDITGGTIQGGSGDRGFAFPDDGSERSIGSAGILVIGGKDNTISNKGTITALNGLAISAYEGTLLRSETLHYYELGQWTETVMTMTIPVTAGDLAVSNLAGGKILGDITTASGDDSVSNAGLIEGNVDLGTGANSISNLAGGVINSGGDIELGAGNTFTNAGDLSPGGKGMLQQTTIIGNFVQTAGGRLLIDIDSGHSPMKRAALTSDVIEVTGRATLAGLVVPNVISIADAPTSEYLIVSAAGGATNNGLGVAPKTITVQDAVNVQDTVAYDFEVDVRAGKDVYLTATQQAVEHIVEQAASAPNAGNSQNFGALGTTLSEAEDSAGNELDDVLQAVRQQSKTPQAAANALNRLTPQQQSGQTNSTNTSGNAFSNAMLSCASRDQPYKFTKEETCYYAKFTARKLDRDATANSAGHDERGYEVMGGAQVNLGGDLRGGFAFGYEDTNGDTFSKTQRLATSDGQRVHGGFVLKNQWGPFNAYLNLAGSYGWYDHTRFVNMGGFNSAIGEQDVVSGLVKLRLSYLAEMGNWYVKPLVDVGATYIDQQGYTESGAGAFNLKVASSSDWLFSVSPAIEIGGEIAGASGTLFRPYIRGGVTVFDKDNISFSANFAGAPVGVSGFTVASELDNVFADVAAGVQVLTTSGVNLRFEYDGRFGEHTKQNAGTVKVTMPF
ncbi:MAG: autotransporter domain-containing protein, partial [Hyphomicrobium sp.]